MINDDFPEQASHLNDVEHTNELPERIPGWLDIRDPQDLAKFPELENIRAAMISAFEDYTTDHYEEANTKAVRDIGVFLDESSWLGDVSIPESAFFRLVSKSGIKKQDYKAAVDELESWGFYYLITKGKCENLVRSFLIDLKFANPDKYQCYMVKSDGKTKHFNSHYVAVIYSKESKLWYCLSPNNIFNDSFSTPSWKRKFPGGIRHVYERMRHVFVANSYDGVIMRMSRFEGGTYPNELSIHEFTDEI